MSKSKLDWDQKRISSKVWTFWSGTYSKRQAQIYANKNRKSGWNARIVPTKRNGKTYYEVYVRISLRKTK